jgi:hypothetical protein
MVKRRLLPLIGAASFLLLLGIDAGGRARAEPAVRDSTAAMLRLHMPFGGRSTTAQTSLTMNFGYHWRLSPGPVRTSEHHFTPTVQAGWMLSGRPVFRVGAIDALRVFSVRADAQAGEASGGGSARFLWIGLGIAAVGGAVATVVALANPDDDGEYERCPILPPPPPAQPPPCFLPP